MPVNSFEDYPMSWKPDLADRKGPKYMALVRLLEEDIRSGALKAGTKLPPQRELADFLDVNLSTVSRAFRLCEQKGLLSASVGKGTFVSSDAAAETIFLCSKDRESLIEMGAIVPQISGNARVGQYTEKLLKKPDALRLFSYGVPEGTKRQRTAGAAWFRKTGFRAEEGRILLAAGGQNALMASLGAVFPRGSRVGTDPLTYPGIKMAARLLGIHLIPVRSEMREMTAEGIRYAALNEKIRGIYLIPDYHNPTAHTMSLERRREIAQTARELDLIIIEDSINNALGETPMLPVAAFAPERTICVASLSKAVSPGLRTAFLHVPDAFRQELVNTLYAMNIAISPLLATVSAGLIEEGIADEIVSERKAEIAQRNQVVDEILGVGRAEGASTSPLRYICLTEGCTGRMFENRAKAAGVQVYGTERFSVGNSLMEEAIRLSVTTPGTLEELEEGMKRLKGILDDMCGRTKGRADG